MVPYFEVPSGSYPTITSTRNPQTFPTKKGAIDTAERKKFEKQQSAPTLTSLVSAAIRRLADPNYSHLFQERDRTATWTFPKVEASAFFVEKGGDENLLRVIINGLWANLHYDQADSKFSFFSLETVRQVIDNCSQNGQVWYALNFDLRHWFHELPLPCRYQEIFGIPLTDRNNTRGEYHLYPRALPMGWSFSPYIAQCVTWALVLAIPLSSPSRNFPKEADLDLEELQKHTAPFPWIPLKSGGGIFVLLDNILVVTPHLEVANYWFDKIYGTSTHFGAHLKYKCKPEEQGLPAKPFLRRQCFHRMSKDDPSETFDFLGVRWSHSSHQLIRKPNEDEELPNVRLGSGNMLSSSGSWSGTHRELASVVSRMMWHRRVYNLSFFDDLEDVKGTQSLLKMFQRMTPPEDVSWDATLNPPLSAELSQGLVRAWRARIDSTPCPADPLRCDSKSSLPISRFAGDAAKDERLHSYVIVEFSVANRAPFLPYGTAPVLPLTVSTFPAEFHIALGELFVIVMAVLSVTVRGSLIIMATDSMNAKHWVESGKANNPEALRLLNLLFSHLRSFNLRLYLVYVPTGDNVADYSTRPHPEDKTSRAYLPSQFFATGRLLALAEKEALGMWLDVGPPNWWHRSVSLEADVCVTVCFFELCTFVKIFCKSFQLQQQNSSENEKLSPPLVSH